MVVGSQRHAPVALHPVKRQVTHCTGGWVVPRAGLDVCRISRPHPHPSNNKITKIQLFTIKVLTQLPEANHKHGTKTQTKITKHLNRKKIIRKKPRFIAESVIIL